MGVITPPVGINAYVVAGIARDVPLQVIFKGSLYLMSAMIILTILLLFFPEIALYLPSLMR
jgi:TRAP-type C4-dicarboxylate transport system permease large subunit